MAVLGSLCLACGGDPYGPAKPRGDEAKAAGGEAKAAGGEAKAAGGEAKAPPKKKNPAVPDKHTDGKPLAKLLPGAPLPLADMLGQPPPKVETYLGPPVPTQKGGVRDSCVRYIPDRTWFRCKFVWQRYSDKTGTFDVVHVTYEDGKATGLSFEKIPGAGKFDPVQALRKVGLELPGVPKTENPEPNVKVWSWFNSSARLLVHERQYRVRVSTVDDKWETAKVEIILNDALNASEKARVFIPGGEGDKEEGKAPAKGKAPAEGKAEGPG